MRKFYVNVVNPNNSRECGCLVFECKTYLECLIGIWNRFVGEVDEVDVVEMEKMIDERVSEGDCEFLVISIIEEGCGVVYEYN